MSNLALLVTDADNPTADQVALQLILARCASHDTASYLILRDGADMSNTAVLVTDADSPLQTKLCCNSFLPGA